MTTYLNQLIAGKPFTRDESYALLLEMTSYPVLEQARFLSLFAQRSQTVEELLGSMDALLAHSILIDYPDDVIDIVGTGGDGLQTFNISTAASLVVASCGVAVAKHGGKRVTSLCGSNDVLTALNIPLPTTSNRCKTILKTQGFVYLSAPLFNPMLHSFCAVRNHLNRPTLFNLLGPLVNPIRPKYQVLGVYQPYLVPIMAEVLKQSGVHRALVVHSNDGLDELSISAPTQIAELNNGLITYYQITPQALGLAPGCLKDMIGGNRFDNARLIHNILAGNITDSRLDIVLLNSAAGLLIANKVPTLQEGIAMARQAIASGQTDAFLQALQHTRKPS